jgi:hypothetical protein
MIGSILRFFFFQVIRGTAPMKPQTHGLRPSKTYVFSLRHENASAVASFDSVLFAMASSFNKVPFLVLFLVVA